MSGPAGRAGQNHIPFSELEHEGQISSDNAHAFLPKFFNDLHHILWKRWHVLLFT